jgi:hypothetical protein
MTILFRCRKCGLEAASLEGHRCVLGPEPRKAVDLDIPATASERAARLEQARAVLARFEAPVVEEVFREAATHGQAFVKDGRVLKSEEVLAPLGPEVEAEGSGFDRAAYQRAYMRAYRLRKRAGATS